MEFKLKTISKAGIPEAISKAELYRSLNEPEEAESICRDILAVEPEHQLALRLLGLAITDQFSGRLQDRYGEAESAFQRLNDEYERQYCSGLCLERRAKAQMRAGVPGQVWIGALQDAMRHFEAAERLRPTGNDDAMLRWNRCVRILQSVPHLVEQPQETALSDYDLAPAEHMPRRARAGR